MPEKLKQKLVNGAVRKNFVCPDAFGIRIEPISKMWIRAHGKARGGEKAEHTR